MAGPSKRLGKGKNRLKFEDVSPRAEKEEQEMLNKKMYGGKMKKKPVVNFFMLNIPSFAGVNMDDYSQRTALAWEIGQPGYGNGFLVSIALQEGTVRIETGSAFEWFIENGTADKILKEVMFPLFRENKFVEGLERGLEEIMIAGRLKPIPGDHKPDICR